jgi:hypothetical protein
MRSFLLRARTLLVVLFAAAPVLSAAPASGQDADAGFHKLSLLPWSTNRLDLHTGEGDCWSFVPRGEQTLADVPFLMETIVEITGMGSARERSIFFPTRLEGLKVGRKAAVLHAVVGTGYNDPDGTPIARIALQYEDGSEHSSFVIYGFNARNWWKERSETSSVMADSNTVVCWSESQIGLNLRLFKTAFVNPHPERVIKSVAVYSLFARSSPVLLAMTLQDKPPADFKPVQVPVVDESAGNSA